MDSKDIIKALECCNRIGKHKNCKKCPLYTKNGCIDIIIKNAFDVIKNQQAEQKELWEERNRIYESLKETNAELEEYRKAYTTAQAEIERLTVLAELGSMRANDYRAMRDKCKTAKTEAYKEFADRLRQHKVYSDDVRFKGNVVDCIWITDILQELTERKED